jgi:sterol 14alpha-demethylase
MKQPQQVSGAEPDTGHLEELRRDPIALMRRVRAECGDVGAFDLAGRPVILLSGADANEYFFRAPDGDLDQAGAYPFMTPIFGQGVVFDASTTWSAARTRWRSSTPTPRSTASVAVMPLAPGSCLW